MTIPIRPQQVIINRRGKPQAVILSIADYRRLIRLAEDQTDAGALRRAMKTSRGTISHTALLERLQKQGLI